MIKSSLTNAPVSQPFMLAGATIEPLLNLISRDGQHFQVERQVMLLLLFLVENVDQVITRESLLEGLWKNSFPKDEALTQAVSKLRKALGDSPQNGQVIQTIRKVGYRLIGPVSHEPMLSSIKKPKRAHSLRSRKMRTGIIAIFLISITSILNNVTVRVSDSGDASLTQEVKVVRVIFSSNHGQLSTDVDHSIDPNSAIEQAKTAGQP